MLTNSRAKSPTLMIASISAALAGVLVLAISEGPAARRAANFHFATVKAFWTNHGIRFTNLGYVWEFFDMYAWVGFYLSLELARDATGEDAGSIAALATFTVVASGALSAVIASWAANRVGRAGPDRYHANPANLCRLSADRGDHPGDALGSPSRLVGVMPSPPCRSGRSSACLPCCICAAFRRPRSALAVGDNPVLARHPPSSQNRISSLSRHDHGPSETV